jgi:type I restriction enzyme M protein
MARKRNGNHQQESTTANQSILPLALQSDDYLTISELETWLWDAACVIRGTSDAPKYKDFILPLIFYKRLSDVFDDEFQQHVELYRSWALGRSLDRQSKVSGMDECTGCGNCF